MAICKRMLVEIAKLATIVTLTHLYMILCAFVYTKLEANQHPLNSGVEEFLIQLKGGHYKNDDVTSVLQNYKQINERQMRWQEQDWFGNFPKTFVFVLAAHTTLGNRHMNVKTTNGQIFYFFTVPLGVLLYYLMIHFVATRLTRIIKDACMLIWRREDDPMTDEEREIFLRIKLSMSMFSLTIIVVLCLSLVSILENTAYITELVYIIDIIYTISSSENFVFYEAHHDDVNALVTALVYFMLVLFAYSASYSIITLFSHHACSSVFAFIFGDRVSKYFGVDDNDKPFVGGYAPVSLQEPKLSAVSMASDTAWLHNDGFSGLALPKSKNSNVGRSENEYFENLHGGK